MITSWSHSCGWRSNSIISKWMFCWERWYWHWNWFLPPKDRSSAIFPKAIPGCRDLVSLNNHTPDQVKVYREGLAFDVQDIMVPLWFLCSNWASRCVRIKAIGPTGQGHVLYLKARVQGPTGLGPCPVHIYIYIWLSYMIYEGIDLNVLLFQRSSES